MGNEIVGRPIIATAFFLYQKISMDGDNSVKTIQLHGVTAPMVLLLWSLGMGFICEINTMTQKVIN